MLRLMLLIFVFTTFVPFLFPNVIDMGESSDKVTISARILSKDENNLEMEVEICNFDNSSVFVPVETRDVNKNIGIYSHISRSDNRILVLASQVYPQPVIMPPTYQVATKFVILESQKCRQVNHKLSFPYRETSPPKGDLEYKIVNKEIVVNESLSFPSLIKMEKVESITVVYGIVKYHKEIDDYLKAKFYEGFVEGSENIFIDEKKYSFYELQELICTTLDVSEKE